MYYSQVSGKWSKRYVSLMAMGQIFISKKQNSTLDDKDAASICHLSDSDIYSTTSQSDKLLRPHKKYCYAIKSQQKSSIFQDIRDSVHFFCTDDANVSELWYLTVQKWRSWYLVYRMGEGRGRSHISHRDASYNMNGVEPSTDYSPMNNRPDKSNRASTSLSSEDFNKSQLRQVPFFLRHGRESAQGFRQQFSVESYDNKYLTRDMSGDVIRKHPARQAKQMEYDDIEFLPAVGKLAQLRPSYSSKAYTAPTHSHSSSTYTIGTGRMEISEYDNLRSNSLPKPLLDFTPSFREAPQWHKSRKGHGVRVKKGVPLVDLATGPKLPGVETPAVNVTLLRRNHSE
jgi:hypothetical protein